VRLDEILQRVIAHERAAVPVAHRP
jgi:hypothetical protein